MRHETLGLADADVDAGLAEMQRHQLAVDIGEVHQRDVADRVELQQFILRQAALRCRAPKRANPARRNSRCGKRCLGELPSRDHALS